MGDQGRITGFGGVFVRYRDPGMIRRWYQDKLGLTTDAYGTSFEWRHAAQPEKKGFTVWSASDDSDNYFHPSTKEFMINLRVDNMTAFLARLRESGVEMIGEVQESEYGKFAHILDPEGVKIELWEARDEVYDEMIGEIRTT